MSAPRRRYPGTGPFGPEDAALFFGRKRETEELYLRILSVPLLLQFGESGLGKTSLLQAGLFPLLRAKPFLPVMIRLNDPQESLTHAVARSLRESVVHEGISIDDEAPAGLWELLAATTAWRNDLLLTPVLVFDQFEEVFTLHDQAFRDELAAELGALATGIPPQRPSAERVERPNVKLLISLKETNLGALEQFSANIPGLFQERLRLAPLSEDNARDAVLEPAKLLAANGETPYATKPFAFDEEALDNMLTYLKGRSDVIEPFQLQLLARHAEALAERKESTQSGPVTLTMADFKGSNAFAAVLSNFYRDVLSHIPSPVERKRAATLCEEGLLGAAGQRLMLEKEQILDDYDVSEKTLARLSHDRLLREVRRMESTFYELSHDRLADSVFAARGRRLPKALKQTLWTVSAVALFLGIFLIVAALLAWNRTVEKERDSAESLLGFLLGEQFLGEVRDIGSSTMLVQVQNQVDLHSADMRSALTRGLALRNRGEIERTAGNLAQSVALYRQALTSFEYAYAHPDAQREIARTHDRLGNALGSQGKLSEAMPVVDDADVIWRQVANATGDPRVVREDCTSMADSALFTVETRMRMGQTRQATAALDDVFTILSEIMFGRGDTPPRCGALAGRDAPYPAPAALRILSNAAYLRGMLFDVDEDLEGAAALAAEARRLQPASLATRSNALVTLGGRGKARGRKSPGDALADYRAALAEFEELRRSDPNNTDWMHERATAEMLVAEGMVECHERPGTCNPTPDLDDAEAIALEARAALNELASRDTTNEVLREDLVRAERLRFTILKKRHAPAAERLALIRSLQQANEETGRDPADAEQDLTAIFLLGEESDILTELGQLTEAQRALQRAIVVATTLSASHPANELHYDVLAATIAREGTLLRAAGDTPGFEAAAKKEAEARSQSARLRQQRADVVTKLEAEASARMAKGATIADDPPAAAREFAAAASVFRQLLRVRPASYRTYEQLGEAYRQVQFCDRDMGKRDERLAALSASMHAMQIAAWLAPPEQQTQANGALLQIRNLFAQALIEQERPASYEAALRLIQESIVVAESLAQHEPANAEYLWSLGNAKCSLGVVRHRLDAPGWEGAIRSGLIDVRKAVSLQPANYFYRENYALRRKTLGDFLAQSGEQEHAAIEYTIALQEYEEEARRHPESSNQKAIAELQTALAKTR
ncbi:MAG: hypothetical protein JOZ54_04425 [Acidobacteria bacterium]|nr:hypothetical protein [Acidobacteriota bacterium]